MKTTLALVAAALTLAAAASAQPPAGAPPMPKPGPEHEALKADEGTWDAATEMFMGPGAPPMTSKGVETNTMGCGGMCLISDFKGEFMGQAYHGHGVSVWDSLKKKYVSTWTDSISVGMMVGESTWDAKTKTVNGWAEGPDAMSGTLILKKTRSAMEHKDADTRVFSMYSTGKDGKETMEMRITYKRKK